MSLEAKIEKLTSAIESLIETLYDVEASVAIPPSAPSRGELEQALEPEQKQEVEPEPTVEPEISHEDVQQLCLKVVRKDRNKKPDLKRILGEYGATLVADVPTDKLSELKAKLEAV